MPRKSKIERHCKSISSSGGKANAKRRKAEKVAEEFAPEEERADVVSAFMEWLNAPNPAEFKSKSCILYHCEANILCC